VSTRLCTGADGRTALLVRADPPKRCDLPTLVEGFGRSISSRPITAAKAGNVPPPATGRVAINTASLAELEGLPGVGPGRARRIVEARAREPFKRIGDLRRVPGFGVKTLRRLKDLVEF
jgi:competence protein ComEA